MITSKYSNPLDSFVSHGVKVDTYTYVLLVDETGQALIQRIDSDTTHIKFARMADPGTTSPDAVAAAIDTFWNSYSTQAYKYMFQL